MEFYGWSDKENRHRKLRFSKRTQSNRDRQIRDPFAPSLTRILAGIPKICIQKLSRVDNIQCKIMKLSNEMRRHTADCLFIQRRPLLARG